MSRKRGARVLWRALALVVLGGVFAAGWVAAQEFQSPEQREASAMPPEPGPVVEPVVAGRLADEVHVVADVGPRVQNRVAPAALPQPAVVTSRPMKGGEKVESGDLILELNGRPSFVFDGDFPFYRDLVPGLHGPDVEQLQRGLTEAGFTVGEWETGTFGRSTAYAVRRFYTAAGYEPLPDGPECEDAGDAGAPSESDAGEASESGEAAPRCVDPGPTVPLTEVAIVGTLPAQLASLPRMGSTLDQGEPVATLSDGDLVARVTVQPDMASRLAEGMSVELTTDDGRSAAATVTSIEASVTTDAEQADGPSLVITPDEQLDQEWAGQEVLARITIDVVSDDALLVPSVAVSASPQGGSHVFVERADGSFVKVGVRVLGELAGQSAVTPNDEGALAEGDHVRVG